MKPLDSAHATLALDRGFRGVQLRPGDPGYDDARRVFNGAIDRRPALIARCTNAADVAAAIGLAGAHDRRSPRRPRGWHGVAGHAVCVGGVMLDLRPMDGIQVDPLARTARARRGRLHLGRARRRHAGARVAVTGGRVSSTGVAGLTLGSGSGWLERKLGYACDNLLAVELVTAGGETVIASESSHPELFWGLRGGGGDFGVATAFHFRLHPGNARPGTGARGVRHGYRGRGGRHGSPGRRGGGVQPEWSAVMRSVRIARSLTSHGTRR